MSHYPNIFLFLSFFIVLESCIGPKECRTYEEASDSFIQPVIHLTDNSPVLYQAKFEVLKYHFSGLIAYRKVVESKEIRIALLSEMGLKLMEFSYANNQISNTYCSPAITKKSIPKFIGSFLELLIHSPECRSACFYSDGKKSHYFCRAKSEKVFVETDNDGRTEMELRKPGNKGVKSSYFDSPELPDQISVQMKYRTTIILKKVANAFK
jgi:hypothetical protein